MKRVILTIWVVITVLLPFSLFSACANEAYYTTTQSVFGTGMLFSFKSSAGQASKAAADKMITALETLDKEVSATKPDSSLSILNTAEIGAKTEISESVYFLIEKGQQYYTLTGGAFNIAVGKLLKVWGLDAVSRNAGTIPTSLPIISEVNTLLSAANPVTGLSLEKDGGKFYATKNLDLHVDLGAMAKGYAADICAQIAESEGLEWALIDISRNLYMLGRYYDDKTSGFTAWNIGVTAPRPRDAVLRGQVCAFTLSGDTAAATAGDYEFYYTYDYADRTICVPHILDGRTGIPAGLIYKDGEYRTAGGVISATVTVPTATDYPSMVSDILSTSVFIMGNDGLSLVGDGAEYIVFSESENGAKTRKISGGVTLFDTETFGGYKDYEAI